MRAGNSPLLRSHLLRASLDLLVLRALRQGPRHGYDIAEWIDSATGSEVLVEEGTLYPALHRLEKRRVITAEWGVSKNNRRAKFYALTEAGHQQLRNETRLWRTYVEAVGRALASAEKAEALA